MMRYYFLLGICLLSLCLPLRAEPCTVRYFQQDARYAYRTALLQLLLEKTKDQGTCGLSPQFTTVTQDRGLALMQEGRIDVVSMPTTLQRERDLRAIRFDILRGLLGYRVLLIRKQQQADFAAVQSLAELRHFRLGFGMHWADLPLLQYNGFRVVAAPHYESLFAMLSRGRFDGFPRGLNEAWQELGEQQGRFPQSDGGADAGLPLSLAGLFFRPQGQPAAGRTSATRLAARPGRWLPAPAE